MKVSSTRTSGSHTDGRGVCLDRICASYLSGQVEIVQPYQPAIAAAKELAALNGISTSAQVELLIRQAARREGLDLKALGRREERRRSRRARSPRRST